MIVRAIEFPVLGISSPGKGRRYAFVARTRDEMRECPLHAYWSGMLKDQYFVDSAGRCFDAKNIRFVGLDIKRMREVGYGASIVSALFSGLNVPVLLEFELTERGSVDLDALRSTLAQCLDSFPRCYMHRASLQVIKDKLQRARCIADLAAAIS